MIVAINNTQERMLLIYFMGLRFFDKSCCKWVSMVNRFVCNLISRLVPKGVSPEYDPVTLFRCMNKQIQFQ